MTRAAVSEKAILVAALALGMLLVSGCAIVPSAYRVDLWKTNWVVTDLDRTTLSGRTISFNQDEVQNAAHVRTPCGTKQLEFGLDTDGDDFSIGDARPTEQSECSAEQQQIDAALFAALDGVEQWSVQDDNHIRFLGTNEIRLTRDP